MRVSTKILLSVSVLAGCAPVAVPSLAQTATVKVPTCLQVRDDVKYFIPCTGVVPVDTATGNALSWADLLAGNSGNGSGSTSTTTAPNTPSNSVTPVQNADGSKIATDTNLLALKTALGNPFQAGGSVSNTYFGARLQDPMGAALGTSTNPLYVTGNTAGSSGSSLPSGAAGFPSASVVTVQGITGGTTLPVTVSNFPSSTTVTGNVTLSGSLPGFANTPTVNIGTMPTLTVTTALASGAATSAKQDATIAAIGTPFQVGGTIGNTGFGAKLQDNTGAAFGTSTNPIYVTGLSGGGSGGAVSGTVTANLGTLNGAATDASVQAVKTQLGSPFQAGGSIANTSFGIAGTLPGFASTPTFNLGTAPQLNVSIAAQTAPVNVTATSLPLPTGAATAAAQASLLSAVGTPVQAGTALSNVVQAVTTDNGAVVGTTAMTLIPANPARRGFSIQNQSTTASCYINGSAAATADYHSLQIGPGGYFEPDHHVTTGNLSIICSAAGTSVYARSW